MSNESIRLDHEQLAADALRLAHLFDGAVALVTGDCNPAAVTTARGVLLEARGIVAALVDKLEGLAARTAEGERALRVSREAQARATAGVVTGSAR